jgi:hypothetical protein
MDESNMKKQETACMNNAGNTVSENVGNAPSDEMLTAAAAQGNEEAIEIIYQKKQEKIPAQTVDKVTRGTRIPRVIFLCSWLATVFFLASHNLMP